MPIHEDIRTIFVKKPCLTPTSSSLDKHQSYTCSYCSKLFSSPSHLSRHMLIHTGEKPCLCSECGQQFSQISSLERHQRTKHEKSKKFNCHFYQCQLCHEYFSLKHNLKMHEKKLHQIPTSFFCEICSAYFTCNSSLQKHRNFRHRLLVKNQQFNHSNEDTDHWTETSTRNLFHSSSISLANSSINKKDLLNTSKHSCQQQVHYQILKCNEIN